MVCFRYRIENTKRKRDKDDDDKFKSNDMYDFKDLNYCYEAVTVSARCY